MGEGEGAALVPHDTVPSFTTSLHRGQGALPAAEVGSIPQPLGAPLQEHEQGQAQGKGFGE